MPDDLCPCGQPLHYARAESQLAVERMVEELGPTVNIVTASGTWKVPRHYIALHGLKEWEVPALAEQYGWEYVD